MNYDNIYRHDNYLLLMIIPNSEKYYRKVIVTSVTSDMEGVPLFVCVLLPFAWFVPRCLLYSMREYPISISNIVPIYIYFGKFQV